MQAIEIEAVKSNLCSARRERVFVRSQPFDEFDYYGVAPHPGWESPKIGEGFHRIEVIARAADVAVDAVGVRPVGFDCDGCKVFLLDQPLRNLGPLAVELMRAVGCLAEQCEACIADSVHERIVVSGNAGQWMGARAQRLDKGGIGRAWYGLALLRLLSPREQATNLFVRRLRKILIPSANRVERLRGDGADDIIDFRP